TVWDPAGMERYAPIAKTFFRRAHGAAVVFAADDPNSWKAVEFWLKELDDNAPDDIECILICNKTDILKEEEKTEGDNKRDQKDPAKDDENDGQDSYALLQKAIEVAGTRRIPLYLTSAKSGECVRQAFEELVSKILANERIVDKLYRERDGASPIKKNSIGANSKRNAKKSAGNENDSFVSSRKISFKKNKKESQQDAEDFKNNAANDEFDEDSWVKISSIHLEDFKEPPQKQKFAKLRGLRNEGIREYDQFYALDKSVNLDVDFQKKKKISLIKKQIKNKGSHFNISFIKKLIKRVHGAVAICSALIHQKFKCIFRQLSKSSLFIMISIALNFDKTSCITSKKQDFLKIMANLNKDDDLQNKISDSNIKNGITYFRKRRSSAQRTKVCFIVQKKLKCYARKTKTARQRCRHNLITVSETILCFVFFVTLQDFEQKHDLRSWNSGNEFTGEKNFPHCLPGEAVLHWSREDWISVGLSPLFYNFFQAKHQKNDKQTIKTKDIKSMKELDKTLDELSVTSKNATMKILMKKDRSLKLPESKVSYFPIKEFDEESRQREFQTLNEVIQKNKVFSVVGLPRIIVYGGSGVGKSHFVDHYANSYCKKNINVRIGCLSIAFNDSTVLNIANETEEKNNLFDRETVKRIVFEYFFVTEIKSIEKEEKKEENIEIVRTEKTIPVRRLSLGTSQSDIFCSFSEKFNQWWKKYRLSTVDLFNLIMKEQTKNYDIFILICDDSTKWGNLEESYFYHPCNGERLFSIIFTTTASKPSIGKSSSERQLDWIHLKGLNLENLMYKLYPDYQQSFSFRSIVAMCGNHTRSYSLIYDLMERDENIFKGKLDKVESYQDVLKFFSSEWKETAPFRYLFSNFFEFEYWRLVVAKAFLRERVYPSHTVGNTISTWKDLASGGYILMNDGAIKKYTKKGYDDDQFVSFSVPPMLLISAALSSNSNYQNITFVRDLKLIYDSFIILSTLSIESVFAGLVSLTINAILINLDPDLSLGKSVSDNEILINSETLFRSLKTYFKFVTHEEIYISKHKENFSNLLLINEDLKCGLHQFGSSNECFDFLFKYIIPSNKISTKQIIPKKKYGVIFFQVKWQEWNKIDVDVLLFLFLKKSLFSYKSNYCNTLNSRPWIRLQVLIRK
ncbi:GTP-binding protein YPTC4, partial [Reticulomyxa filosa]